MTGFLNPVPVGALPGAIVFEGLGDRIAWMLDVVNGAHEAHPNTAASMIARQGPRFLVAHDGSTIRHVSHRLEADGTVEMSVYTPGNPRDALLTLHVANHAWNAHPDLVPPPVAGDEESDASPGLEAARRFAAFYRAHLPAALEAIARSSVRGAEDPRAAAVRERVRLAALAISSEADLTATVTAASPLGGMAACPSGGAMDPDPCSPRLTPARMTAWSQEPVLDVRSFTSFGTHIVELGPVYASADARCSDPLDLLRQLRELPPA